VHEEPVLLRVRREGRGAVEQPLVDLGAKRRRRRIKRAAGLLAEIFEDGAGFAERDARAARALVVDQRRDLVARADLHEIGIELFALLQIDRAQLER